MSYNAVTPEEHQQKAKIVFDDSRTETALRVSDTPKHDFLATISVPRRSELWVRLSKGDLKVVGVSGDKEIEARSGNVAIEVADPNEYAMYDASVTLGNLAVPAWHISKTGVWRSFHKQRSGGYRLRAHVGIGSLAVSFGLENPQESAASAQVPPS